MLSCFSHLWLCDPMDCSLPGSSVHGILQVRILEAVAMSSSRGSSQPRDQTCGSCIAGRFFTTEPPGKPLPLLRRTLISLWGPYSLPSWPHLNLITSQRLHLQIPSHWELGLQHMNSAYDKSIQSMTETTNYWFVFFFFAICININIFWCCLKQRNMLLVNLIFNIYIYIYLFDCTKS